MAQQSISRNARVAIIGAGFSGIAAATALIRDGVENFTMFESAPGLGGTWWHNRYPGAEVDLESHIYSFSFEQYDWSRTHAEWHEILAYLNHVAQKWDLGRRIRLNERVDSVIWDDESQTYSIELSSGTNYGAFDAVISGVGFLNIPLIPPFARGDHPFPGPICHTSRWSEGLSLENKRVGILGTGSSGVQIVTEATKTAQSVTIFQLEPNWIVPKEARDFTEEERKAYSCSDTYFAERQRLYDWYDEMQRGSSHAKRDGHWNQLRAQRALDYLQGELAARPDLIELVTPKFPFESRRTVNSDSYYQAIQDPKVRIVPFGAQELTEQGIRDSNGEEHELDVVVFATGFDAANYLGGMTVRGRDGRDLHEAWAGEPSAFLGMMVPDFPNFFMMYGPNTNSIPLVTFYEAQAAFIASVISSMDDRGASTVDVSRKQFESYNTWLQDRLGLTVWGETRNYFQSKTGKIVSQWPDGPEMYLQLIEQAKVNALEFDVQQVQ
ncbi:NAD(P)/FAD-dependent oxidoreductase [Arthrobacter sp. UCD-GKA]|uniref:flavin-containing monooxygenase n=1 Tax=Arthrobacter sp. UCD-GKA TaxID=1913576 RepID=UPI000B21A52A|nr:NAD(P)/FAD-dependent oxidoreductase [Arthrobacter sp. UCD-GKA]